MENKRMMPQSFFTVDIPGDVSSVKRSRKSSTSTSKPKSEEELRENARIAERIYPATSRVDPTIRHPNYLGKRTKLENYLRDPDDIRLTKNDKIKLAKLVEVDVMTQTTSDKHTDFLMWILQRNLPDQVGDSIPEIMNILKVNFNFIFCYQCRRWDQKRGNKGPIKRCGMTGWIKGIIICENCEIKNGWKKSVMEERKRERENERKNELEKKRLEKFKDWRINGGPYESQYPNPNPNPYLTLPRATFRTGLGSVPKVLDSDQEKYWKYLLND